MSAIQGFPTQQKTTTARPDFVTVNDAGSGKHGLDVISKAYFRAGLVNTVVSFNNKVLEVTAHGAIPGDMLRFETGANQFIEVPITEIVDVDHLQIASEVLVANPILGDTLFILRGSSNRCNTDGSQLISTAPAPIIYNLDGVDTNVTEDTSNPANNRPLPSALFIYKDGVQIPINKDTGTPGNTTAVPVEIVSASGTTINITAGDIDIHTTDLGLNFDSMRIGDGSGNYAGFNASSEALVHDADVKTALTTLNAKDFATSAKQDALLTELQLKADLTETQPVSLASVPLPTGASTSANQATEIASLASIDGKVLTDAQLRASAVPVSIATLPLPSGSATLAEQQTQTTKLTSIDGKDFATQTTLSALNTKVPANLTVTATRLLVDGSGVTQPISASALPLPTGASTLAEQQTQTTKLTSIDGKDFATQTTLSALNAKVTSVASTPISIQESDGTNFLSSIALAASQLTTGALTKLKAVMAISMGWDGTTHRELSVDTSGKLNVNATVTSTGGAVVPTLSSFTDTDYTVPAAKTALSKVKVTHGMLKLNGTHIASNFQTMTGINADGDLTQSKLALFVEKSATFTGVNGPRKRLAITLDGYYNLIIWTPSSSAVANNQSWISRLENAVTGEANAATGKFIITSVTGFAVNNKVVIQDANTAKATYYITAINVGTNELTMSTTLGGAAANLTAYTIAQTASVALLVAARTDASVVSAGPYNNGDYTLYSNIFLKNGDNVWEDRPSGGGLFSNSIMYTIPGASPVTELALALKTGDTLMISSGDGLATYENWYSEYTA